MLLLWSWFKVGGYTLTGSILFILNDESVCRATVFGWTWVMVSFPLWITIYLQSTRFREECLELSFQFVIMCLDGCIEDTWIASVHWWVPLRPSTYTHKPASAVNDDGFMWVIAVIEPYYCAADWRFIKHQWRWWKYTRWPPTNLSSSIIIISNIKLSGNYLSSRFSRFGFFFIETLLLYRT